MDARTLFVIPDECERGRADKVLATMPQISRTRSSIAHLIKAGYIKANGLTLRPSTLLGPGDEIELLELASITIPLALMASPSVPIIYEDENLLVVDKPAGLVTHPGAGARQPTLMDIVINIRPQIIGVGEEGRWGIVHRLDKDTSGVMVIAKNQTAYSELSRQFKQHSIHRVYKAIVKGNPKNDSGSVDSQIGRDSKDRKKMTTKPVRGRSAHSDWRVLERFSGFTLLEIRPKTGRTHQIRAHLASVNMPVLGDKVYGAATTKQIRQDRMLARLLNIMERQALHAAELGISMVGNDHTTFFMAELPDDMQNAVSVLRSQT